MTQRYLLDTNIVTALLAGKSSKARERFESLPASRVCISVITEAEIRYGLRKRPQRVALRKWMEQFLDEIAILPWTSSVAQVYAELRASNEGRGISLSGLDMLIAAHSVAEHAILVTNDAAFAHVSPDLRVENWLS